MKDCFVGSALRRRSTAMAALLAVGAGAILPAIGAGATPAAQSEYVQEDAKISGKEIHLFTDGGEDVTVILGDFALTMGRHAVSGRDAVVWVRDFKVGAAARRDITVYVEGGAKVVDPGGATTTDRVMLVSLHQQGRLAMAGNVSDQSLIDFPLYKNAVAARRAPAPVATGGAATQVGTAPSTQGAATTVPAATGPATTRAYRPVEPLTFEARKGGSTEIRGNRRITIAREVYLSLGNADSEMFLEMTAQSAVAFSEKRQPKDARVPWAAKFGGGVAELGGAKEDKETLVGIYLEGDVVIRRGERYLRGPAAYYDFTTDRAVVVNAVFRTVQEQRNIPIYIRAEEARALSARELYFKNAKVTTSDFYSPGYHIGATSARVMDITPYDEEGVRLGPRSWHTHLDNTTFNVGSVPILYWPHTEGDLEQEHTALRKVQVGSHGRFGLGVETEWHLFRLLGLVPPEGFVGLADLNYYARGPMAGARLEYAREKFSGYSQAYGMLDRKRTDVFGDQREDTSAPEARGRVLARHKQVLPEDWELQFELSYLSDKNFLEQFFPDEFYAGKEQETLIYAKKQKDNWALTSLLQYRLNRFETQTESAPDLGLHLVGQPLLDGQLVVFSESHAGLKHFRPASDANSPDSGWTDRLDTRNEVDVPLKLGPVNVVPYATGRATHWGDTPDGGGEGRLYGQAGVKADLSTWRVYKDVTSRVWDVNGLKHVVTPEGTAFVSGDGGVKPSDVFPMDADIERHLQSLNGVAVGVNQRLMTKRGPEGDRHQVDWMRLNIGAGFYDAQLDKPRSDGRFFWYRPEYSLARNHVNGEYTWNISDATVFMADLNWDLDSGHIGRSSVGLAVARDPRLRYYLGWRRIEELNSSVGTAGVDYQINRKYSISVFEQYDFDYRGGTNLGTSFSIIRKMERWFAAVTFTVDQRDRGNDFGLILTLWPEGIPEFRLGTARMGLSSASSMN